MCGQQVTRPSMPVEGVCVHRVSIAITAGATPGAGERSMTITGWMTRRAHGPEGPCALPVTQAGEGDEALAVVQARVEALTVAGTQASAHERESLVR